MFKNEKLRRADGKKLRQTTETVLLRPRIAQGNEKKVKKCIKFMDKREEKLGETQESSPEEGDRKRTEKNTKRG